MRKQRKMETKLTFNSYGLLTPAEAIPADMEVLKRHFVDAFPKSKTRARLYTNFEKYIDQLQKEVFPWFEVWLDGSFVTAKENPNDLDIVVLLDYQVQQIKRKELEKYYSFSLEKEGIDAYIVPVFAEEHTFFEVSESQKALWLKRFTENRNEGLKGFLVMNFGKLVE
jgi:hypothetical protein